MRADSAKEPMYEESHACCSVLAGRIRNLAALRGLATGDQFRWLHDFYLLLDRIADQHKVYKLQGGPQGFLVSTAVAEPDEEHAATLLRFALHLHAAVQDIQLPCGTPLDLSLALASGEATSGLLGSLTLTYQIVGRCMLEAQEMIETQRVPVMVAGSMHRLLRPEVARNMVRLGSLPLRGDLSGEGQQVCVYSLPRYGHICLTRPAAPTIKPDAATATA